MPTLNWGRFQTSVVAERSGYSAQQIRNLEQAGVLPPATRGANGYRSYQEIHLCSALAYRSLAAAVGPVEAKSIMVAVHRGSVADTLAWLDTVHARLARERDQVRLARAAVAAITAEPIDDVRSSDAMTIAELAGALGVRASTLRHWDAEGLVLPDRVTPGGPRCYSPAQVRDARIVHQLRAAGHRIDTLRAVLPEVRRGRRLVDVVATLAGRDADITRRSRALLDAAGQLDRLLAPVAPAIPEPPGPAGHMPPT